MEEKYPVEPYHSDCGHGSVAAGRILKDALAWEVCRRDQDIGLEIGEGQYDRLWVL